MIQNLEKIILIPYEFNEKDYNKIEVIKYNKYELYNIDLFLHNIKEYITSRYLVQILNELRLSGIINSKRGKQGGYALVKSPDQISLYSIVESVDPEFLKVSFENTGQSGAKVFQFWSYQSANLVKDLTNQTLDSLMGDEEGSMYYI